MIQREISELNSEMRRNVSDISVLVMTRPLHLKHPASAKIDLIRSKIESKSSTSPLPDDQRRITPPRHCVGCFLFSQHPLTHDAIASY